MNVIYTEFTKPGFQFSTRQNLFNEDFLEYTEKTGTNFYYFKRMSNKKVSPIFV